jgi:hypothetical protein
LALAADDAEYRQKVQPFLAKNCANCHNDKLKLGNLSLANPQDAVWDKVLDKLSTGRMPPLGAPQPPKADIAMVTAWIERLPGRMQTNDPGRVTSRRLNRAEYNQSVRDLLGVSLRPADEFPLDDAGYGFDNIGDVLGVSPLLMEKYMSAAKQVSTVAVYGHPAPARPTKLVRFMSKKSQDDPTPGALPYSYRGAIYGTFDFPVTGEYELRMRVANYRPRSPNKRLSELFRKRSLTPAEAAEQLELGRLSQPAVRMVLTLDGKQILTEVVEGSGDFQYAHGESVARVKVTAGEHAFRASYPEFAGMPNPRTNVNPDGRRGLFIDYVDVVGPFDPATEPPASKTRLYVCREQTPACAERILTTVARRAYRRPVTREEIAGFNRLTSLVRDSGDSFDEGIRVGLQAILMSPNFLFRAEPLTAAVQPISEHDLASRLASFLWSSLPDEELMRLADAGQLRGVLSAQVKRMLADSRSDLMIENFVGQWLGWRLMDRRRPDPARFPMVDDELLDAMRQETFLFAKAILRENRGVLDFIDGPFTYLNGPLARHYGIPGVTGEVFERVELKDGRRGGVMTQGSVLTLSSYATRTSPVLRGRWVLENLLGTPPPPAPRDIPALEEANLGTAASLRQRLELHRINSRCAVCHDQMDAIGFGLENFDASGAWRDKDGQFVIDNSGKFSNGESFHGPAELKQVLKAQSGLFIRNFTEKLLTYALGRGVEVTDRKTVDDITNRAAVDGYRFQNMIHEIVASPAFLMRGRNREESEIATR